MVVRRLRDDELYHHGVKGQRWGVRRYQNPDGTLTAQGEARLAKLRGREIGKVQSRMALESREYAKVNQKLQNKIDKAEERGKTKKVAKLQEESKRRAEQYKNGQAIANKEINALKNYKLSDFAKEKHNVTVRAGRAAAESAVRSMIGTALLTTISAATMGAVPAFAMISTVRYDSRKDKTAMRLGAAKNGGVRTDEAMKLQRAIDNNRSNEKKRKKYEAAYKEQLERDKRRYG